MRNIDIASGTNVVVPTAAGMPAGLYPGRRYDVHAYERQKYDGYLALARAGIADLGARQTAMSSGSIRPGCIDEDVLTCMVTLSRTLAVATSISDVFVDPMRGAYILGGYTNDPLLQHVTIAVDGRPIFVRSLTFYGYIPRQAQGVIPTSIQISVHLDSNRQIRRLLATLPRDPLTAHTAEEYNQTGLFEVVNAVVVPSCTIDRMSLYRTVETEVRANLRPSHDITLDMDSASETYAKEGKFELCGRTMWLGSIRGVSTDLIGHGNPSGSFGGGSLIVE